MTKLIHSSPLGRLDIPGVGSIPAGEEFEVSTGQAATLLEQSDLYHRARQPRAPKPTASTDAPTTEGDSE